MSLSPGLFADAIAAEVAYDSIADEFLVTWHGTTTDLRQYEDEIFGQRLDATGAEIGVNDFRISDMGPEDPIPGPGLWAGDPAAAFGATGGEYLVVWRGVDTPSGETEIYGQRIGPGGPFVLDRWGGV